MITKPNKEPKKLNFLPLQLIYLKVNTTLKTNRVERKLEIQKYRSFRRNFAKTIEVQRNGTIQERNAKYISRTVANTGYPRIERCLLSTMSKHLLGSKIAGSGIGISIYKITILPQKNPITADIVSFPSTTCSYRNNKTKRKTRAQRATLL